MQSQNRRAGDAHTPIAVYADRLPLWDKGEYFPLAYSRAKVEEVTRHRLKQQPVEK
jgi:hypothetical protein